MKKKNLIKTTSVILSVLMLASNILTAQAAVVVPTIKEQQAQSAPTVVTPTVKGTVEVTPTVVTTPTETEVTESSFDTVSTEATESSSATIATEATETTLPTVPTETESTDFTEPTETEAPTTVTKITVKKNITVYVNKKTKLNVRITDGEGNTHYTSSNKRVVEVKSNGTLIPKKKGKAVITIENNGVTATTTITVKHPQIKKSVSIYKGKTYTIKITGKSGKANFETRNKTSLKSKNRCSK